MPFCNLALTAAVCELYGKVALSFFHEVTPSHTHTPPPMAIASYWPYHCCLSEPCMSSLKLTGQISDKIRQGSWRKAAVGFVSTTTCCRIFALMPGHFFFQFWSYLSSKFRHSCIYCVQYKKTFLLNLNEIK